MDHEPQLPFPISSIGDKFFLFDIEAISWLRRTHHICGVMTGTLPQNPSQNVFLGLPLQIMPEEAQLLIEKGVGYLLDDARAHSDARKVENSARHADYMAQTRWRAEQASKVWTGQKEEQKRQALSKQKPGKGKLKPDKGEAKLDSRQSKQQKLSNGQSDGVELDAERSIQYSEPQSLVVNQSSECGPEEDVVYTFNAARLPLFSSSPSTQDPDTRIRSSAPSPPSHPSLFAPEPDQPLIPNTKSKPRKDNSFNLPYITPTTSALFLPPSTHVNPSQSASTSTRTSTPNTIPNLPPTYPLYRHLNSKSYFITPGLRFGCQYCVYPGDPLRFHSHFLAVGYGWDDEIDLMDVVGGGRLGTGVKKGWLIGGEEATEQADSNSNSTSNPTSTDDVPKVRTFSIEWAVM